MADTHVIEYELTEEMAVAAAEAVHSSRSSKAVANRLRSLLIQLGIYGLVALGALIIGIQTEQPWWFFIAPAAMLALSAIVLGGVALAYLFGWGQRKHVDEAIREGIRGLNSRPIRWTVTNDILTIQSGNDVRMIQWSDVIELTLTGTFWLLTATGSPTMLLSGERIPDTTARFVLQCAQRAGTRIRVVRGGRSNSATAS